MSDGTSGDGCENDRDKIDAERYRKLRVMHWNDGGIAVVEEVSSIKLGSRTLTLERLDAALDAIDNVN